MDVAIQAKLDANKALIDAEELFQRLENARSVAARIVVPASSSSSILTMANATSILSNAQQQLATQLQAVSNMAANAATAMQRLAAQQQVVIQVTNQQAASQMGMINQLLSRVGALVLGYFSLREAVNLVRESMASRIEMDRLDVGLQSITNDAYEAGNAQKFLVDESNRLGLNMREVIPQFIKMSAAFMQSGFTLKETEQVFTNLAIATKTLGLSSATTGRILYDFQEMVSMGTVQMRQLRQVLMQMPGGLDIAAQAMGVTGNKFHEMVKAGMVDPMEFVIKFTDELGKRFSGNLPQATDTLESHTNRVKNAWLQFTAALGDSAAFKVAADGVTLLLTAMTGPTKEDIARTEAARIKQFQDAFNNRGPYMPASRSFSLPTNYNFGAISPFTSAPRNSDELAARNFQMTIPPPAGAGTEEATQVREKELTEANVEAIQKMAEISERMHIASLDGLKRELAQIELNGQREIDLIDEQAKKAGASAQAQDAAAKARLSVLVAQNQAEENVIAKDAAKEATEAIAKMREDSAAIGDMMRDLIPDDEQRKISEIEHKFDLMREHILDIANRTSGLIPDNALAAIDAAEKKAINESRTQKSPTGFYGDDFNALIEQRDELRKGLLTAKDAGEFQKSSQQIQEISQALALRLKYDAISIHDAFQFGFKGAVDSWGSASERMAKMGSEVANSISTNMTGAISGLILGTKSAGQAFSEMASAIISDLVRIAVEEMIVKSILSAFGMGGGGGAGAPTSAGGGTAATSIGIGHGGGVVGLLGSITMSAPRYHGGGVIGDEVPIVARRGEVIFTPEQMNALAKAMKGGGGRQQRAVEIVNVFDERIIDQRIAANPDLILNAISQRSGAVRRMLS